ncbi:hypothetical protein KY285_030159 [Solanum tuberosum]|nr:hypothetical protein KY285_030159 [Solanum tuberosum]
MKREESSPKPVNASDPVFDKGPGSIGKNKKVDKLFSQEERVEIVRSHKVLSGRVFDMKINTKPGMGSLVDAVEIQS